MLHLPFWATDYLKRAEPELKDTPLALYERIKGGLRLAAIDTEGAANGLHVGQNLANARAIWPGLTVREIDRPKLEAAFGDFADWHSNASPLVSVMTDMSGFGDLVLDITGVAHLFGGEKRMLRTLIIRLRKLGYRVTGAIAPTIGAAWGVSHFGRIAVLEKAGLKSTLDALPVAGLRLHEPEVMTLAQMGLKTIGQVRTFPRKSLHARFGSHLVLRLDQAFGAIEERMTPRLPLVDYIAEQRFAEPISLMDDVLRTAHDLAVKLGKTLEAEGLGAQAFHLFLYRVDHKVMTLSLNAARVTRNPDHIADLFRHRAQRLEAEYDPGFGIDMVRLAASSVDRLDAVQTGAFSLEDGIEDIDQLNDRLASRLGPLAVLSTQMVASRLPERAARLLPAQAATASSVPSPVLQRPLKLLPVPEAVSIMAEVPHGLPAAMVWRGKNYRLVRGEGPERLKAEWWRQAQRLELVEPPKPKKPEPGEPVPPPPYIPDLPLYEPDSGMRDYYVVEDQEGRRFWVFRQGLYGSKAPIWYLHGFFP